MSTGSSRGLADAVADPNDNQEIFDRMQQPDNDHRCCSWKWTWHRSGRSLVQAVLAGFAVCAVVAQPGGPCRVAVALGGSRGLF